MMKTLDKMTFEELQAEVSARRAALVPELVEALEECVRRLRTLEGKYTDNTDWCTSMAEAAVKKAKGLSA